jgi:hypothetical protein
MGRDELVGEAAAVATTSSRKAYSTVKSPVFGMLMSRKTVWSTMRIALTSKVPGLATTDNLSVLVVVLSPGTVSVGFSPSGS